MTDYWGKSPIKQPIYVSDSYTAKQQDFVYNGQRVTLFRFNIYFDVGGYLYANGTTLFSVPTGETLCITAIMWNLCDITAPAPITTNLTIGWSDQDVFMAYRTEDGNPQNLPATFPAPYPEIPSSSEVRMWHTSAVGAPSYRGYLNVYGFFISKSVNLR